MIQQVKPSVVTHIMPPRQTLPSNPIKVEIRRSSCKRIVAYKMTSTSGFLQMKCPKCKQELNINLSLRRSRTPISFRRLKPQHRIIIK